jgi:hypothetical protein
MSRKSILLSFFTYYHATKASFILAMDENIAKEPSESIWDYICYFREKFLITCWLLLLLRGLAGTRCYRNTQRIPDLSVSFEILSDYSHTSPPFTGLDPPCVLLPTLFLLSLPESGMDSCLRCVLQQIV